MKGSISRIFGSAANAIVCGSDDIQEEGGNPDVATKERKENSRAGDATAMVMVAATGDAVARRRRVVNEDNARISAALPPSDPTYWSDLIFELRERLESGTRKLPALSLVAREALIASIDSRSAARQAWDRSAEALDRLTKDRHANAPPVDPADVECARMAADAARATYEAADRALLQLAAMILEPLSSKGGFLSCSFCCCCSAGYDDSDLLLYMSLMEATPPKLASWCGQGEDETAVLLELFGLTYATEQSTVLENNSACSLEQDWGGYRQDKTAAAAAVVGCCCCCCSHSKQRRPHCRLCLLRRFHEAGRPRHAEYGRAAQLYRQLGELSGCEDGTAMGYSGDGGDTDPANCNNGEEDPDAVCDRLAVAAALEFCCETDPIDQPVEHHRIDPAQRYRHYRDAYLKKDELDPAFGTLTSWEMRMALNSDASETELQWGRDCLRNYRPDIVTMDDPQWRYCYIVRQDVDYKDPDWYKPERSYDQILSGGGECGPRGWFGRFVLKAFGIPTWGVRQPGHAALARWTSVGEWRTCLGAGFDVSEWDGRCGNDFELEARTRIRLISDAAYRCRVLRLELMAHLLGESDKTLRSTGEPDVNNLWFSVSLLQRRILARTASSMDRVSDTVLTMDCERMVLGRVTNSLAISDLQSNLYCANGSIVIPASSGTIDPSNSNKVIVMKSFSGGSQLFLGKDGEIEYSLERGNEAPATYKISLLVCTVHRIQEPLSVMVSPEEEDVPATVIILPLPYTVGMWQETEPVAVEMGTNTRITLTRQEPKFGVAIKYIIFAPVVPSDTAS
jgi:hypothetical protein